MTARVKILTAVMLVLGACSVRWAIGYPNHDWVRFAIYLALVLLSSGLKVAMPKGDGTASVNFPLILLGVVQLSPGQAIAMAALSVLAQCRIKVIKPFTLVQIAFNVANTTTATALAVVTFTTTTWLHLELAPALALASVVYFLANTVPLSMAIGWSSGESPVKLWRREFPWYLPFYIVGAILAAIAHMISLKVGWTTSLLLLPAIYVIYRAYQTQMAGIRAREKHLQETEALHLRTIEGLAMAIEAKDHNTHDHLVRVRVYVSEIGTALNLTELEMQALMTAAFLHDIGKLAVPEHIINKPGKLTPEEFEKIKIHPIVGADILERVRFPYPVVPIVRSHHEAWDGSGYPDGLKGEEIPIGARILTVVDCFDALASDRPYRKAMPTADAMALIKSKAGSQFDPRVVEILEERYIHLEDKARNQSGSIAALITDVSVQRGEAPGAGFQQDAAEAATGSTEEGLGEDIRGGTGAAATRYESLNLIAAASQEAQALFEMSQMLGNSLSPNETISVMSARLRKMVPFDCFALYVKGEETLVTQYIDGEGAGSFTAGPIPLGEGLSGWVAQNRMPILNANPKVEPNYQGGTATAKAMNAALSVPLFDLSREVFGVLTIYSSAANAFSKDHLRILLAIESKFSLSLQNALRFRDAETDASIDLVTQLPNARQFFLGMEGELNEARVSGSGLCVVVCDLNAFRNVNDHQGRIAGNQLLRSVADSFRRCCRSQDTVARLGGDEFVFLLPGMDSHNASAKLDVIRHSVKKVCRDLKIEVEVTACVGAAFYPVDGDTAEQLLGVADRRMYLSKRAARDGAAGPAERSSIQLVKSA